MSKHVLTTDELKARIYNLRQVRRFLAADPATQQYRIDKHMLDRISLELAEVRHFYYQRANKDQFFIRQDLKNIPVMERDYETLAQA